MRKKLVVAIALLTFLAVASFAMQIFPSAISSGATGMNPEEVVPPPSDLTVPGQSNPEVTTRTDPSLIPQKAVENSDPAVFDVDAYILCPKLDSSFTAYYYYGGDNPLAYYYIATVNAIDNVIREIVGDRAAYDFFDEFLKERQWWEKPTLPVAYQAIQYFRIPKDDSGALTHDASPI